WAGTTRGRRAGPGNLHAPGSAREPQATAPGLGQGAGSLVEELEGGVVDVHRADAVGIVAGDDATVAGEPEALEDLRAAKAGHGEERQAAPAGGFLERHRRVEQGDVVGSSKRLRRTRREPQEEAVRQAPVKDLPAREE